MSRRALTCRLAIAPFLLLAATPAGAQGSGPVTPLPMDGIALVNGIDAACTGIGDEAQEDPRWQRFPIRIEVAGRNNEYLADVLLTVATPAGVEIATVRCEGPWVLLDLDAGEYRVTALVPGAAAAKTVKVNVPARGQRRAVIQFPEVSDY